METDSYTLDIANAFSETPYGRYRSDGDESGEVFREDVLIPALNKYNRITILLDGVEGLPSSFWEEVMGGLIRAGWALDTLKDRLEVYTNERELEIYVRLGWRYAEEAATKNTN
ncbi:MAG TPA: STAS-like domain-containing protein [Sphingomonas sp.]|nr:STAS-like domain-containing protein [Sphingomonas sp.]